MRKIQILSIVATLLSFCCFDAVAQNTKPSKSNMTLKEWNVDANSNRKSLDHHTIYNEAGKKVEESEYNSAGLKWRKKYEYSEDGRLLRELVYGPNNKLDNVRKFEFNEVGRKKIEYVYDAKGRLIRYKIYEYTFVEQSQK